MQVPQIFIALYKLPAVMTTGFYITHMYLEVCYYE
jgi:hypothetical protein